MKTIKSVAFLAGIVVVVIAFEAQAQSTTAALPELRLASPVSPQNVVVADIARLPKWQRVRDWMVDGDSIHGDRALAGWASWAVSLRGLPVAARLDTINRRVNAVFRYAPDIETWGIPNYWGTPAELMTKAATDCKGFAIMKFWLARLAGLDDSNLA